MFYPVIEGMLQSELDSQTIFQAPVAEHGFTGKCWSMARYVRRLTQAQIFPFRRLEVELGLELQVVFGIGRPARGLGSGARKTYVFHAVLSHSSKGYTIRRQAGKKQPPSSNSWAMTIEFAEPQQGPMALGYASHYGLGLFQAEG